MRKTITQLAPPKGTGTSRLTYLPATEKPYELLLADFILPLDIICTFGPQIESQLRGMRETFIWKMSQLSENAEARLNLALFMLQWIDQITPLKHYISLLVKSKANEEINVAVVAANPAIDKLNAQIARGCSLPQCPNRGVVKKCVRCSKSYYCNADCQRADWPRHKNECIAKDPQQ